MFEMAVLESRDPPQPVPQSRTMRSSLPLELVVAGGVQGEQRTGAVTPSGACAFVSRPQPHSSVALLTAGHVLDKRRTRLVIS
jgi:hypothetical protein